MNNKQTGHFAELAARFILFLKGYRLIAGPYVTGRGTKAGEIDIIVCRGKELVFVEVKKRTNAETAAHAVSKTQQQRIRRAAEVFLGRHKLYGNHKIRFDVFLFWPPFCFKHIPNAF